ncbi:MAG: hypothetical protein LBD11_01920 [Candidatus Peribacteria bacterium]|nr:hypothetical protein [Candidatus Peribacteria bacterium]
MGQKTIKKMLNKLLEIKGKVESLSVAENADIQKNQQDTGFNELNTIVPSIKQTFNDAVRVVKKFLPFHNKTAKKLETLNTSYSAEREKAENGAEKRGKLKEYLNVAQNDLRDFQVKNQLTDSDLKSSLLKASSVFVMVFVTLAEMAVSYASLSEYFDGWMTIVGVNGLLGLASSLLAMFAGQFLAIDVRIRKEIYEFNESELTSNRQLSNWIKQFPLVSENKGSYSYRSWIMKCVILFAIGLCGVLTVAKFALPLRDGNEMAIGITIIVFAVNLILSGWEFFTYSGLHYPIRLEADKLIRKVENFTEKAQKEGVASVEEVEKTYNANKAALKKQWEEEYKKIQPQIDELDECEKAMNLCRDIVITFEQKANKEYDRIKSNTQLPKYQKINNLF